MSRDIVDLDDVLGEEREELAQRRKQAGFVPLHAAPGRDYRPEEVRDPIGLAVSGGGVRSAAFSLGVIQALYERGMLRFCDYLSTVSGGSYVGGFLTSLAVHGHTELAWTKRSAPANATQPPAQSEAAPTPASPPVGQNGSAAAASAATAAATSASSMPQAAEPPLAPAASTIRRRTDALAERITIEPDAQHRQPHYVRRLVLGSSYLERPLLFLSHWLPGFLQNNVIAISLLLCTCALGAWLFRLLDVANSQRLLRVLGFGDDISRAFFPTVVVFTIWMLVLLYRGIRAVLTVRSGHSSVAPVLTLVLLLTVLVSAVSLIGVGDISTTFLMQRFNIRLNPDFVSQVQTIAQWVLYTVLAVAIIPYLSPAALVRSGAEDAPWRERIFFKFMTHAMLWGVPLVLFGMLASENVAQIGTPRDDQYLLAGPSVKDWSSFAATLDSAPPTTAGSEGGKSAVQATNHNLWTRLEQERYTKDLAALAQLDPSLTNLSRLQELTNSPECESAADLIRQVARESEHRAEVAQHTYWHIRLGSAIAWFFGTRDGNEFEQLLENEWKFTHDRALAVALINDQLLHEDFSRAFQPLTIRLGQSDGPPKSPPDFFGDATAFLKAQQSAERIENQLASEQPPVAAQHIDRFRQLRRLEAIISYHLAVAPDRARWASDLLPLRDSLRQEVHKLQHPVEHLGGSDEIAEAAIDAKLHTLEQAHFQLLYDFYGPKLLHPMGTVFGMVVSDADQRFRLTLFGASLAVFLIAGMCIDLNSTSLHRFYRDRLASVWLVGAHDKVPLLTDLKTSDRGAPYLLVNCALSFLRSRSEDREATAPFFFSYRACGSTRLGFAATSRYEGGRLDLADAMAISGGAVTPTATRNLAVQALMWLMNWRLGRWMANPSIRALLDRPASYRRIWQRPQALHLLLSWLLVPEPERDFHFVSDGGLHENLGLEPLIERRCRLIFAIDAGSDPQGQFEDLVKLLLRLRLHHGVEIEALNENSPLAERTPAAVLARSPLGRLLARDTQGRPTADGCSQSHFVLAKIRYPDQAEPGWLVYVRPGFDGDESEALRRFRVQHASFPNDSTDDQFFTFARFEAYRLLGEHIGHSLCAQLTPNLAEIDAIPALLERVARHAASAAIVTENTLSTTPSGPEQPPREPASAADSRLVQAVDHVGLFAAPLADAGSPPTSDRPVEMLISTSQPTAGGNGAPAPRNVQPAAEPESPPAIEARLKGAQPTPPEQCDQLLLEIDAIVDEIRTSRQDKPAAALERLEQKFDELFELNPTLAVRELRRIHRRLFPLAKKGRGKGRGGQRAV